MIMPLNFNIIGRAGKCPGRCFEIMVLSRILAGIVCLFILGENFIQAGQSVTLSWQPSSGTNVVGYNIYYGSASQVYTNTISVGNVAVATIGGLVDGTTYYFAATSYDAQSQESGFSDEVTFDVPAMVATNVLSAMQIRSAPAGQFVLTVSGTVHQGYDIEATEDFSVWTVIGTVIIGTGGSLDFTDTNAASFQHRFYRTHKTP
jgi:Fibronectin type III domain